MTAGLRLLRRWSIGAAIACVAVGCLLVGNTRFQITGVWPETSSFLFIVSGAFLLAVALKPASQRRLTVAITFVMLACLYRAAGIFISDPPSAIQSSGWVGIIVYTALAYTVGFIGIVFRIVQTEEQ